MGIGYHEEKGERRLEKRERKKVGRKKKTKDEKEWVEKHEGKGKWVKETCKKREKG